MSTTDEAVDHMAEAAGLILAKARGDDEAVTLLIASLIEAKDFRGAIFMLSSVVNAAGLAIKTDVEEAGQMTRPVELLVGMTRLNRMGETNG